MGYLDIKDRENIDEIISKTLSVHYQTQVSIGDKKRKDSFILNPRLNCAIYSKAAPQIKKAVQIGHAIHKNIILNLAMRMYIKFGFSRMKFFGCKYINFNMLPDHPESLLIMPGNMKIKVFDYQTKTIINILKEGFNSASLSTEIKVRTTYKEKPYILPLEMLKDGVYREALIEGCSVDRLDRARYSRVQERITQVIQDFQKGNRCDIDAREYCCGIVSLIENKIELLRCNNTIKEKIKKLSQKISERLEGKLIISDSHGDLQNGNIFVSDNDDVYLLDWETYGIRSIGYDILTYYYKFRYRADYLMRLDSFLLDDNWDNISSIFWDNTVDRKQVLIVYLLEDIIWHIEECLSTEEKRSSPGLLKYSEIDFQKQLIERL